MILLLEIWKVYIVQFLSVPFNATILLISLIASGGCYVLFKRTEKIKAKVSFLYSHIFFLLFPFLFSAFISQCWQCVVPICDCSARVMIYGTLGGGLLATLLSFIFLPYLYTWANKSKEVKSGYLPKKVKDLADAEAMPTPRVYLIQDIAPLAYSITNIRPSIFISVGLCEVLSGAEMEAILLHELYHIQRKTSFWKFSYQVLKIFSPLAGFMNAANSWRKEEEEADNFAVAKQGTPRFLRQAKDKVQVMKRELGQ